MAGSAVSGRADGPQVQRRELHVVEREFAQAPGLAPPADQSPHPVVIKHSVVEIAFALVPDNAPN